MKDIFGGRAPGRLLKVTASGDLGFSGGSAARRAGAGAQEPQSRAQFPPPRGGTRHSALPEPADLSCLEWKAPRPEVEGPTQEDKEGGTSAPRLH